MMEMLFQLADCEREERKGWERGEVGLHLRQIKGVHLPAFRTIPYFRVNSLLSSAA